MATCVAGDTVDSCAPGAALAVDDATCDAVDDDCDGHLDEDVTPVASSCGVGGCGTTGVIACVGGELIDSCVPNSSPSPDVTCDNVNDDCDEAVDEHFVPSASNCGFGACARMGTITCAAGNLLDSCVPGTPGANDTTCNGQDDELRWQRRRGLCPDSDKLWHGRMRFDRDANVFWRHHAR